MPKAASWASHLRAEPHRMRGDELKATIELLRTYDLRPTEELRQWRPDRTKPCRPLENLATFAGYRCVCAEDCDFCTQRLAKMHDHMPRHGKRASQHHEGPPLWRECRMQTYFTARNLRDYFVVEAPDKGAEAAGGGLPTPPPSPEEGRLFSWLRDDMQKAARDLEGKAAVVEDAGTARADRQLWLRETGFALHLRGLSDAEIKSSYKLPPAAAGRGPAGPGASDLAHILAAADSLLRDAYGLCSDRSLGRKMTQQRALRLSDFAPGAPAQSKKMVAFRSFKNESTLTTYFRRMKQLLVYYYRVVYLDDGHFTRQGEGQTVPRDVIQPSERQVQAMDEIMDSLEERDETTRAARLKRAVRELYIALACHEVGSARFQSPMLSFCAMLSRRKPVSSGDGRRHARDELCRKGYVWQEPGNFNSALSAVVWSAQLLLFDFVCFEKRDDEGAILRMLDEICQQSYHNRVETSFGHILQWRLYLFAASRAAIARNQARWSLDGQRLEYMGIELSMAHISELLASEYRQAYALLYDELLLGSTDIVPIESWRLHDDLDVEDYGGSWLTDGRNAEVLAGTQDALLRQIERRPELRRVFVRDGADGEKCLCTKAIAIYEAHVQEFLRRMVTLVHISPCPPLRAPELLSVIHCNTGRRRSILIWEKMVMMYVRYHKSQEQTGAQTDNVRFLPRAVGDLLLTYLAVVQPLRQTFLRQMRPGALLSPYLWSKLEGEVWGDTTVSSCLGRACARASVPQFQVAWWRQAAASITKEKFSARSRANFDMDDIVATEELEDEAPLVVLAEASNHSYGTFNRAYAGTTTLTMSTLLSRAYRASESWRGLFGVDQLLQGKRPVAARAEEQAAQGIASACKRTRLRTRPTDKEAGILAVARRLHNDPELQLRRPGQQKAMLATMGPRPAEQVVVVLATGSGKSLIVMVAASLEGAGTTVMVLPTVGLRINLIDRLSKMGIRYAEWTPNSPPKVKVPLVLVSAEAACTQAFLQYALRLSDRQQLDRIVVDECHLTVFASDYRPSMAQLGWFVRAVPTQTVWMTATLPPVFEEEFIERNKLVRPRIIRESTDRPNIRYKVQRVRGVGSLSAAAARLVQECRARKDFLRGPDDKIILYCRTKALVAELGSLLGCPQYIGGKESPYEEKKAALGEWLGPESTGVIAATSALGIGFDYAHVRWVIHVGAPKLMSEFSQETGRAGRDGEPAESIVLLSAAWKPQLDGHLSKDQEPMQLFLVQRYCSRGVISQYNDTKSDWKWCMVGDELCEVCPEHHTERRPAELEYRLPRIAAEDSSDEDGSDAGSDADHRGARAMEYTGPSEILRQAKVGDEALARYEKDIEALKGCCVLCRVDKRPLNHSVASCPRQKLWMDPKRRTHLEYKRQGKQWIPDFLVCFLCLQPQTICPVDKAPSGCAYPDMVMPLCYRAFNRQGRSDWFSKHFGFTPKTDQEYMRWLGEAATLGNTPCIQANRVAALMMAELQ